MAQGMELSRSDCICLSTAWQQLASGAVTRTYWLSTDEASSPIKIGMANNVQIVKFFSWSSPGADDAWYENADGAHAYSKILV